MLKVALNQPCSASGGGGVGPAASSHAARSTRCLVEPGACTAARPRILVVDDVAVNRLVLSRMLHKLGFEVLEAADGKQCLDLCHRQYATLDCVLLDLHMPVMDGWDTAVQVRQWERGCLIDRGLPLLACTAECLYSRVNGGNTVAERAYLCGMDECIAKPAKLDELKRVLSKYVPALAEPRSGEGAAAAAPLSSSSCGDRAAAPLSSSSYVCGDRSGEPERGAAQCASSRAPLAAQGAAAGMPGGHSVRSTADVYGLFALVRVPSQPSNMMMEQSKRMMLGDGAALV